jgi:hypothetical protein
MKNLLSSKIEMIGLAVVLFSQAVIVMAHYEKIDKFINKFIQ